MPDTQEHPDEETSSRIQEAVKTASEEKKRVLLIFGADWCHWCSSLYELLEKDTEIKDFIQENYCVVIVDVGLKDRNLSVNEKYGNPIQLGLPVFVVLDKKGDPLHTQETQVMEHEDKTLIAHQPSKVMDFLATWAHREIHIKNRTQSSV